MSDTTIIRPGPLASIAMAIRARLELAFPPKRFTHQWMPSRIDKKVFMELSRRAPMIGIGFNGLKTPETTGGLAAPSHWTVYVVTRNENGNQAVLFGDRGAPGQLALAEVAASILHGFTIKGLASIQMMEAANAFVEDYDEAGLSVTVIEVSAKADLNLPAVLGLPSNSAPVTLTGETIEWSFDGATQTDTITIPKGDT